MQDLVKREGLGAVLMTLAIAAGCAPNPDYDPDSMILEAQDEMEMAHHDPLKESMGVDTMSYVNSPDMTLDVSCQSKSDCRHHGPWRTCYDGQCMVEPRGRTLLVEGTRLQQPVVLRPSLNGVLNGAIQDQSLNLVIHLGAAHNWLIQGVETGHVGAIPTFGQASSLGSYCGESPIKCSQTRCTTVFRPDTDNHEIFMYVKTEKNQNEPCEFQRLRLADVKVQVEIDVSIASHPQAVESHLLIMGTLPYDVANDFMLDDDTSLLMMMDDETATTADDDLTPGWPIILSGTAREVYFDNDPGHAVISRPNEPYHGDRMTADHCPGARP